MVEKSKVLIVDDDDLNLKLFCAILSHYELVTAQNGEEAIEVARRFTPDLILMDIQLPGMDGLTATRALKQDPDLKTIPVVALTSFAMVGDKEKALSAGFEEYITKPIDIQGLKSKVAAVLERFDRNAPGVSIPCRYNR